MIYPCIDLMNGKIVQLVQGRRENKKIEISDYEKTVRKFKDFKVIQLIDLDAAMEKGNNYSLIKKIIELLSLGNLHSRVKCRVGGGIRTVEKAEEVLKLGAQRIIISSSVFKRDKNNYEINYDFLKKLNNKINKNRIIIAVDTIKEEIVIKGWKEKSSINIFDAVEKLETYCCEFLATYVDKEGMLKGTNVEFFKKLKRLTKNELTAAGGITTLKEVEELEKNSINSALGMAVYTNKIKLADLIEINNKFFK